MGCTGENGEKESGSFVVVLDLFFYEVGGRSLGRCAGLCCCGGSCFYWVDQGLIYTFIKFHFGQVYMGFFFFFYDRFSSVLVKFGPFCPVYARFCLVLVKI